ncbi:MAG: D-alanyl-D-alanine carboxypeptidase, partial [Caldilineaceae bacterium]|nr:D-alanyl-D-alanine carboxypeptidase [Caldilineaceae bacterium]
MFRKIIQLILLCFLLCAPLLPARGQVVLAQAAPTADFGDAPDSRQGTLNAYPDVVGNFPTLAATGAGGVGPFHQNARLRYVLGYGVSGEDGASAGTDNDGVNNLDLALGEANQDGRDDGLSIATELPHCQETSLQVAVTAFDLGQSFPESAYVNVWFDFDRNGRWGEVQTCPGAVTSNEWAVQNHMLTLAVTGTHVFTLPTFVAWNEAVDENLWVRVMLSDQPAANADGSGPDSGYGAGETEDYLLESVGAPTPVDAVPTLDDKVFGPVQQRVVYLPFVGANPETSGTPGDKVPPSGDVREVDVAHLGGTGNPTAPIVITVAGSGDAGKLSSWRLGQQTDAPVHLQDGPQMWGFNHQLHVLTPESQAKLNRQMLLSARILDGDLWLTTWRVNDDGVFEKLDTRGYGANAAPEVNVVHYDIAHRQLAWTVDEKRLQVATPVLHKNGMLRLITWEVDGLTGVITGKYDGGDIGADASPVSDLSVVFNPGDDEVNPHYAVSLTTDIESLTTYFFDVSTAGQPKLRGVAQSGRDIRNNNSFVQKARNLVTAPLADTGIVSALDDQSGSLRMHTWETLRGACPGPQEDCLYQLSNISHEGWDQDLNTLGVQLAQPALTTIRALLRDPRYDADLFAVNADVVQAIASVRKVMVTIVALDAVKAGDVSLDDVVTVSAAAANVNNSGASVMGLEEGERITLRNLLYGNMMRSAGDATWAISEHVAGNLDNMVTRMDAKAAQLGMSNTQHCQQGTVFSSVAYSTARDQAILWESVYNDPLFLEFAGASSQDEVCGLMPNDWPLCHPPVQPMTKGMTQYPQLDGHKTGGGGGTC